MREGLATVRRGFSLLSSLSDILKTCRRPQTLHLEFYQLLIYRRSVVCDVNGWSFVKGNKKYYRDACQLIIRMFTEAAGQFSDRYSHSLL